MLDTYYVHFDKKLPQKFSSLRVKKTFSHFKKYLLNLWNTFEQGEFIKMQARAYFIAKK